MAGPGYYLTPRRKIELGQLARDENKKPVDL
jgi:hypothetical protein